MGTAMIDIKQQDSTEDLADSLKVLGALATAGGRSSAAFDIFAKLARGDESGAKATPEDKRMFGLDRLPWNLKDVAVKQAKRRAGGGGARS